MFLESESYCIRHSEVAAVGRCRQCGVPYCSECKVQTSQGNYCSMECRAKHKRFANRSEELNRGKRGGIPQKAIFLVLVAVGLVVVLHFFDVNVPILSDLIRGLAN